MNKRHIQTIGKSNLKDIDSASRSIELLYEKTKRFESTREMRDRVLACLRVLKVFCNSHTGQLTPGVRFPYGVKKLLELRSDARMVYSFAMNNKIKGETLRTHVEKLNKVFDLSIARAEWLGVK